MTRTLINTATTLRFGWLIIAILLCMATASCRRTGTAVPADVEIEWPDAAPYKLAKPPRQPARPPEASPKRPNSDKAGNKDSNPDGGNDGNNASQNAAPTSPPQPSDTPSNAL